MLHKPSIGRYTKLEKPRAHESLLIPLHYDEPCRRQVLLNQVPLLLVLWRRWQRLSLMTQCSKLKIYLMSHKVIREKEKTLHSSLYEESSFYSSLHCILMHSNDVELSLLNRKTHRSVLEYCTILINSAVPCLQAPGLGRIRSAVPCPQARWPGPFTNEHIFMYFTTK